VQSAIVHTGIVFEKDCLVCADSEVYANAAWLARLEQIAEEVGGLSKTVKGFSEEVGGLSKTVNGVFKNLNGISNKIDRMQMAKSIKYALLPSSGHSKGFNETVVNYYGVRRKCCVSGEEDPGNQNLPKEERVIAAHLISSKNKDAYLELNKGRGKREFLTEFSPRSCVLMQRKWEILFDRFAWCFVPANPMSDAPIYKICVLVDMSKQDGTFEYWKNLIPADFLPQLDSCIATLLEFQESGKEITFTKDCCPSFRAMSRHLLEAMDFAESLGWVGSDDVLNFVQLSEFSPMHSSPASEASDSD
jgi:hypothetical protein